MAGVAFVDVAHALRVGWAVGRQRSADIAHEGKGRCGGRPQPEDQSRLIVGILEAMAMSSGRDEHRAGHRLFRIAVIENEQTTAQYVDRLVELVVGMGYWSCEVRRDRELGSGETRGGSVLPG